MTPPPHTYFAAGDTSVGFTPETVDAYARICVYMEMQIDR